MTDDEILSLIRLKSEGANLDYKAGFEWTKDNRDKKYELIRDLMALSNAKDGGRIIFGVRDEDLAFVGVSPAVYESADPTSVIQMLHDNSAPKIRCAVFKREIDGKRIVVLDVAEFDEIPTICTNTVVTNDGAKRTILRKGAVYVRTGAATTEEIPSADDMRALISRAVTRKSDQLLQSINDLLTGNRPDTEAFAPHRAQVLGASFEAGAEGGGWMETVDWEYVRQEVYGKGTTVKQIQREVAPDIAYVKFWRGFRERSASRPPPIK